MNNKLNIFIFSLLLLACTAALADSATRSVEATTTISARPEEVLDAFLDDDALKAWWKVSRSLVERKAGGIWSITWDDWGPEKTQHAWIGVIEEITPDRLVVGHLIMIEPDMPLLGPMQLEITVKPDDGGSVLAVSHRGYGYGDHWDSIYEAVVQGWDHVLGDMEAWVQEEY
ncbi:MAG: SRPBCC domain-containing protein [Gammaproteobacteria bacterium]|nr:MAG: SRPBCC domain-containing protein [Gammaproteobacteria bacterium]